METTLHRQLKELYATDGAQTEVPLGRYRIDVVTSGQLVEIQHGSLAAIRDKVRRLVRKHQVLVVKPLVVRKRIIRQAARGGKVLSRRYSPKQGTFIDLFHELIYFTRVFPHPNLTLEAPLVEIEEWRYPGHGRRWRRRARDHQVEDQRLVSVGEVVQLRRAADLCRLVPCELPDVFHTGHLAEQLQIPRWVAQRIAYCFRQMGAAVEVGKQGNARLYALRKAA